MNETQTAFAILFLINIVSFCLFWWDKDAARSGEWRIPESRLLWMAFLGGSAGAIIAQQVLRHKTRKEPFRTILQGIAGLHVAVLALWIFAPEWPARIAAEVLSGE